MDARTQGLSERSKLIAATKIERQKWVIKDEPGEFAWINKADLNVDHTYQRDEAVAKVLDMAREWSWISCGAISVSLREDGSWWVMDGQHRVLAAHRRSDITELPCMVFEPGTIQREAQGFLDQQTKRKPVSMTDKYRAMLVTEDPTALKVKTYVEASGRRVTRDSNANTIVCVSTLMSCINTDERAFARIWPLVIELCEGASVHGKLVAALHYIEHKIMPDSISRQPWRGRLQAAGLTKILNSMQAAGALYGGSGVRVGARGIVTLINRGARTNKLSLGGDDDAGDE